MSGKFPRNIDDWLEADAARGATKRDRRSELPATPCSPAQCKYVISGSEGVCQERATHVVTTSKNKYPMEVCEAHSHVFQDSKFKVTKLENE